MIDRRKLLTAAALMGGAMLLTAAPNLAIAGKAKIFTGKTPGVAINGYDPVGYFSQSKAVIGSSKFSSKWNGTTWHFASAANRDKFAASPAKFAPQYGGYCAYAVSYGSTAKTEPEDFSIVKGKLYLNYSTSVKAIWQGNIPGHIAKANKNWSNVLK